MRLGRGLSIIVLANFFGWFGGISALQYLALERLGICKTQQQVVFSFIVIAISVIAATDNYSNFSGFYILRVGG